MIPNVPVTALEWQILRAVVGSTAHGLALAGTDDLDLMGVFVEPPEHALGLFPLEHWIERTAETRAKALGLPTSGDKTPKSGPGDVDLVLYSLKKFCRLAAGGNPTVLLMFFSKPLVATATGYALQKVAPLFYSKRAGHRFLGYLQAQRERLLGQRGQQRVKRPELEAVHGYDTKFAMHAARLGFQGNEYLATGKLELPMPTQSREVCMAIRQGRWEKLAVVQLVADLEDSLKRLLLSNDIPEEPQEDRINAFMINAHFAEWENLGLHRPW